jgi:ribonuclease E
MKMAPNNNNWQDFAADLGLSFEVDPNAPELPPEPEMLVGEAVVTAEIAQEGSESVVESSTEEETAGESGTEDANGNKKRRRGRRRRKGRGEGEEGTTDADNEGLNQTPDEDEPENGELVGAGAGLSERRSARAENANHHRPILHHHHDDESPADDDNFVLEDLSNLSLPSWTELIDSLYRPER